jgi:hypothetical protein
MNRPQNQEMSSPCRDSPQVNLSAQPGKRNKRAKTSKALSPCELFFDDEQRVMVGESVSRLEEIIGNLTEFTARDALTVAPRIQA